jgi:hypothetical protein
MNVCSWYYLIPTYELGSSKHYKVKLSHKSTSYQENQQQQKILTDVNKDIINLTKLKFIIDRNEFTNDFGFTITGSCPCIVGKVDPEKDAFSKGLRPGDYIVKIHDINVSRATCESVVKLIKNCKSKLIIEIHREKSSLIKVTSKSNNIKLSHNEATAQYINQIYFNNTATDTTTSSGFNTDFSGKSIDLPQYSLKLYSLNEINSAATTSSTSNNDSFEFLQPTNEDEDEDEEFYSNLVPNSVEHNEIPFVDEDDEDEHEYVNSHFMMSAQFSQQNPKICQSRLLIKNEARNRAPLIETQNDQFI